VRQTFSDTGQVMEHLSNRLVALKESFDLGVNIQSVITSANTLRVVEKLGPLKSTFYYFSNTEARNNAS
jgi:hypothetical protein